MKNKPKELDVDFIGGQETMTQQEELAISAFIKSQKLLRTKKTVAISRPIRQKKKTAV